MAEQICRTLRNGTLEGEHAVSLAIKDSLDSPFGVHAFGYFFADLSVNVSSGKSQAGGIVLLSVDRSPSSYLQLLKGRGLDVDSSDKWLSVLDCYSDPLGWKMELGNLQSASEEASAVKNISIFRDLRNIEKLLFMVLNLGKGLPHCIVGEGKARFSVAIDSISTLGRHTSLSSIAKFISNLRTSEKVSSIIYLMHSDIHEPRLPVSLEYISTMVASLEPEVECSNGESGWHEQNLAGGRFSVRLKRRNGRVKILSEKFHIEQGYIRFAVASMEFAAIRNLVPKVHFNLQLSDKERADRAKVVLPFEHQGNGGDIKIYDGRPLIQESKKGFQSHGKGEIHYIRDSDDELLDSDEDPDDDLDI